MKANDLATRLYGTIYPVMITAGAAWGASGEMGTGFATLLGGLAVALSLSRQPLAGPPR